MLMKHRLLREYIELLLSESAEEDSQLVGPEEIENSQLANVLQKINGKAIPSSKSDKGFVGKGMAGQVYDILYKGHRAALKITKYQDDFAQYKKLYEIQDTIPTFVRRSLPHIYSVIEFNDHPKYYATIMEFLIPLPNSIAQAFDKDDFPYSGELETLSDEYSLEDPRLEHLYMSMRWLVQHGILESWEDIAFNNNNAMIRPSTGDIVIADIGLFEWH